MSCRAASVMLATTPAHASDAQVVGVRGTWASSRVSPHEEDISLLFERAPRHVRRGGSSRRRLSPSSMTSEAGVTLQASEQAIMLTIIARTTPSTTKDAEGQGQLQVAGCREGCNGCLLSGQPGSGRVQAGLQDGLASFVMGWSFLWLQPRHGVGPRR